MAEALQYTLTVYYNANGGSGAPSTQVFSTSSVANSVTVSGTISSTRPFKAGYTFACWTSSMGTYWSGGTISKKFTRNGSAQSASVTLTAQYTQNVTASTWGTIPSSVILNGSTEYTFNINKSSTVDHHSVSFTLGSQSLTYNNVSTSQAVTFPLVWEEQLPNSASGQLVCTLTSYNSSNVQIGNPVSTTVTAWVAGWRKPTLSITASRVNSNSTVDGWDILLQGYSAISFTATAAGIGGSSIASIEFSGAGVQQTGTATTATSSVLTVTGSQTWTVTATDTRGRTASQTYTETVYAYTPPSISTASARRCTSGGTIDEATGTYALFSAVYSYSTANGNNTLSQIIDSKLHTGSTWTTNANSYTSNTDAVIGGGAFDSDKTYDIRLTITDALGNSAVYSVFLASVSGFAYGLKNDRARFGGVPDKRGLTVDWNAYLPQLVQFGSKSAVTVSAGSTAAYNITYSTEFNSTPSVVVGLTSISTGTLTGFGSVSAIATVVTTTGFTLTIINTHTADLLVGVSWVAVAGNCPIIVTQPEDANVSSGTNVTFSVVAENATSYKWQYKSTPTGTWTDVSAASGSTANYSLIVATRHNGYTYRCKVSNANGYTYTHSVTLTVS